MSSCSSIGGDQRRVRTFWASSGSNITTVSGILGWTVSEFMTIWGTCSTKCKDEVSVRCSPIRENCSSKVLNRSACLCELVDVINKRYVGFDSNCVEPAKIWFDKYPVWENGHTDVLWNMNLPDSPKIFPMGWEKLKKFNSSALLQEKRNAPRDTQGSVLRESERSRKIHWFQYTSNRLRDIAETSNNELRSPI